MNNDRMNDELLQAVLYGVVNSPEWAKGDTGEKGDKGDPGFSPTIDVKEDTDDTYILTITDVDGSYDTPNLKGSGGSGGSGTDGEDGGYYEPSVDSNGNLSWTASKEDMPAVDTVNIKGPAGQDGTNGQNGQDGKDGVDGYSPVATVTQTETGATISITDKTGTTTAVITNGQNGTNGQDGQNGQPGQDGENGATFTPTVDSSGNLSWSNDKSLPNPQTVNIKGKKKKKGADGEGLPAVTTTDNGKFARVVDGVWSAVALTNAEEVNY